MSEERAQITGPQYDYLRNKLRAARVATREQGGKTLSYLEAWDVRAHLIRIFGYGNFDLEVLDQKYVGTRTYESRGDNPKPMAEVTYVAHVRLTVRNPEGQTICIYSECAAGSESGPDYMLGDLHDNALKTAVSDAVKRCAINLGTQFGLSLYKNGSRDDVVGPGLIRPDDATPDEGPTEEQTAQIKETLGGTTETTPVEEPAS